MSPTPPIKSWDELPGNPEEEFLMEQMTPEKWHLARELRDLAQARGLSNVRLWNAAQALGVERRYGPWPEGFEKRRGRCAYWCRPKETR